MPKRLDAAGAGRLCAPATLMGRRRRPLNLIVVCHEG
jgi:hypothetical protein